MLSFKPTFSLSCFTFIKRLFSSSSLYAIRVVSAAYLKLLIFLLAILIPACASSSPAFLRMYSEYKLNKQGDNIQPWHTPFPIWNQSVVPCPFLTIASWPAYRFPKRQVRWSGIQNFPQFIVIHTVKGLGIVNKAETFSLSFYTDACFFMRVGLVPTSLFFPYLYISSTWHSIWNIVCDQPMFSEWTILSDLESLCYVTTIGSCLQDNSPDNEFGYVWVKYDRIWLIIPFKSKNELGMNRSFLCVLECQ